MAKAETNRGPFESWTWVPSMIASMPPPPVLMTTPTRSRSSSVIAAKSIPASATASLPAAIARWMNRLIRRAIFGSIAVVGSKSMTSAAIRTSNAGASKLRIRRVPVTPATRFDQYVGKSLPIGMTAPRPVTTARRAGSISGKVKSPQGLGCARIVWRQPDCIRRACVVGARRPRGPQRAGSVPGGPGGAPDAIGPTECLSEDRSGQRRDRPRRRDSRSVAVVALEDDGAVVAAEADVVRQRVPDRPRRGLGRRPTGRSPGRDRGS